MSKDCNELVEISYHEWQMDRKDDEIDELKSLLKEACKELKISCEYDESWMFYGQNQLVEENDPEKQRYNGFTNFLKKPEIIKILEE